MSNQHVRQLNNEELKAVLLPDLCPARIRAFLSDRRQSKYSQRDSRWSIIPTLTGADKNELYKPLAALFNCILKGFGAYKEDQRKVLKFSNHQLNNLEGHTEDPRSTTIHVRSSPPLCAISLCHDHFPEGISIDEPGYHYCASPIEVKRDGDLHREDHCLDQCAMYARQCFVQQTGRRFVFVPLLTESRVKLYRFDRGGVVTSEWINYHDEPELLIRVVLLISGFDAIQLGLNPFLTWEGQAQFITINAVKYKVERVVTSHHGIGGRGTCVWRVCNPDNVQYVIKYQWRAIDRKPEWKLLEKLKGLSGVVNMVSHCVDTTLYALRGFKPSVDDVVDREAAFIIMDAYGPSIANFQSPEKFLVAFRDAIAGHQNIWDKDIIHRDISINNVLFGKAGAAAGSKGVVIDLDIATDYRSESWKANSLTGTRVFQSHLVLSSGLDMPKDKVPAHDHLDDLESFFWVFLWIVIGFRLTAEKSEEINPRPASLVRFQQDDAVAASQIKRAMLLDAKHIALDSSWPQPFITLKTRMAKFLHHHTSVKKDSPPTLPVLRKPTASIHYAIFLSYIDQAIQELNGGATAPLTTDFEKEEKEAFERLAEEAALLASGSVELKSSIPSVPLQAPISSSDIPSPPIDTPDTLSDISTHPDADFSIVDKRQKRDEHDCADDIAPDSSCPKAKKLKKPLSSVPTLLS